MLHVTQLTTMEDRRIEWYLMLSTQSHILWESTSNTTLIFVTFQSVRQFSLVWTVSQVNYVVMVSRDAGACSARAAFITWSLGDCPFILDLTTSNRIFCISSEHNDSLNVIVCWDHCQFSTLKQTIYFILNWTKSIKYCWSIFEICHSAS